MIVWALAPTRIDLAGGFTDVPPYSTSGGAGSGAGGAGGAGGAVVNVAIALHAYALVRPRPNGVRITSADFRVTATARRVGTLRRDGRLELLKAAVRRLPPPRAFGGGFELATRCDAPPGSGLGSSGAIGVAVVAALERARGARPRPVRVAADAHRLEVWDAGVAGGKQDQYAAALGGVHLFEFRDPAVRAVPLRVPPDVLVALERRLVLCYTGRSRVSARMIQRVMDGYRRGDGPIVRALDGLRRVAYEMAAALEAGDLDRAGALLALNWRHQSALDRRMETASMRRVSSAAGRAGALGHKACGAGAGGCLVFLAREGREEAVAAAVRAAGASLLPVEFDRRGVVTWAAVPNPVADGCPAPGGALRASVAAGRHPATSSRAWRCRGLPECGRGGERSAVPLPRVGCRRRLDQFGQIG